MSGSRQVLLDGATLTVAISATLAVIYLFQAPGGEVAEPEERALPGWEEYARVGHRFGPDDAAITIILFSDYDCPACRRLHASLKEALARFPDDIRVVYRHYPLHQHRFAYGAARAAECAAAQGHFLEFHDRLFMENDWLGGALSRFAVESGIEDLIEFERCLAESDPHPAVEADREAGNQLELYGTPAIIFNGTLMYELPPLHEIEGEILKHRG